MTTQTKTETDTRLKRLLEPGYTIEGRYEIIENLAHGGFGQVYKAVDKNVGNTVAIKFLAAELYPALDDGIDGAEKLWAAHQKELDIKISRFRREVEMAASLQNQHCAQALDTGHFEEDGLHISFLVTRLVPGKTLNSFISQNGRLTKKQCEQVLKGVLLCLEEAHTRRYEHDKNCLAQGPFIHRDIKTDNILVTEDNWGNLHPTVIDFGLGKPLDERSHWSSETIQTVGSGDIFMTPHFAAPEQFAQLDAKNDYVPPDIGPYTDIYSLGVVMYNCYTGRHPIPKKILRTGNTMVICQFQKTTQYRMPDDVEHDQLCEIINKMLLHNYKNHNDANGIRYLSCTEVLNDLHLAQDNPKLVFESELPTGPAVVEPKTQHSPLLESALASEDAHTVPLIQTGKQPSIEEQLDSKRTVPFDSNEINERLNQTRRMPENRTMQVELDQVEAIHSLEPDATHSVDVAPALQPAPKKSPWKFVVPVVLVLIVGVLGITRPWESKKTPEVGIKPKEQIFSNQAPTVPDEPKSKSPDVRPDVAAKVAPKVDQKPDVLPKTAPKLKPNKRVKRTQKAKVKKKVEVKPKVETKPVSRPAPKTVAKKVEAKAAPKATPKPQPKPKIDVSKIIVPDDD